MLTEDARSVVVDNDHQIAERDGPNGLTRQSLLDEVAAIRDFDVNGWWAPVDFSTTLNTNSCFVMLQVQGGEFVRVHPEEPGTLDCETGEVLELTVDPEAVVFDN